MRFLRILLPAVVTAVALDAAAGCGTLKSSPEAPDDEAGADGSVDGGQADGAADGDATSAEGGPAGSVCTDTTCTVETLFSGLYGPVSIAVDSSHLYWIEAGPIAGHDGYGELARVATTFTCKTSSCFDILDDFVISGQLQGELIYDAHVALGLNNVCYTQSFNANAEHTVKCYGLTDLAQTAFDDGAGDLVDLWVGATQARWVLASTSATSVDGQIRGRPLDRSADAGSIATGLNSPIGVASDDTNTYWTELGASSPNGVIEASLGSVGPKALFSGRANPTGIRLYGQYLYWIEQASKLIVRGRLDGTGTAEQIATTDDNPADLVVDASGVYWIASGIGSSGVGGSLSHAPLEPSGVTTIMMSNINEVYSLAADSKYVYVASVGQMIADGKIQRIAKTR